MGSRKIRSLSASPYRRAMRKNLWLCKESVANAVEFWDRFDSDQRGRFGSCGPGLRPPGRVLGRVTVAGLKGAECKDAAGTSRLRSRRKERG